ncbi:MAG: tetratricopeptide repeat protein [Saprospiraceae bacterium]|nr:tetratricopeptide repeat protein [Candidatus Vicinibacter affinis]
MCCKSKQYCKFLFEIGNFEKAEILFLEAKSIREISLGKEHPEYAKVLTNLAILYTNIGRNLKKLKDYF